MSVFFAPRRATSQPALQQRSGLLPWLWTGGSSYSDVNLAAAETSMQSVAVRSCVDLIASMLGDLPKKVYSGEGADRRERPMPGYLQDPAGDGTGLADWCYQLAVSWLLRGNAYGDVLERSPSGFPTQVVWFWPDDVNGWIDSDGVVRWSVRGQEIRGERMLHRRVNPVPGRVLGLSPIAFHADQIGVSLTATRFGRQWFSDGAHPGGILSNDHEDMSGDPDGSKARTVKERFMTSLRGTREPVVLGRGWKWQSVQISPEESQFLATQGWSEAQCARIFGPGLAEVLGYESGGSMTYANVESRSAHLLVFSLSRWFTRLDDLLTAMLPRPQYVRTDRDAMLQSTTLERYRAHESALKNRWKTVNEVRDDEDMSEVDWGYGPNAATPDEPAQPPEEPTGAEAPPQEDGS